MFSYRLTDEANNPVYESIDKDLDIKSNEEKQALQPSHVYHELEDPKNPTHEYSIPYEASMSISDGPKITPALNDSDSLTHFNELYETSEVEIWVCIWSFTSYLGAGLTLNGLNSSIENGE